MLEYRLRGQTAREMVARILWIGRIGNNRCTRVSVELPNLSHQEIQCLADRNRMVRGRSDLWRIARRCGVCRIQSLRPFYMRLLQPVDCRCFLTDANGDHGLDPRRIEERVA